jgi:hypothetical protein
MRLLLVLLRWKVRPAFRYGGFSVTQGWTLCSFMVPEGLFLAISVSITRLRTKNYGGLSIRLIILFAVSKTISAY